MESGSTCERKKVSFSEVVAVKGCPQILESDLLSSDKSFAKIITSEGDTILSLDEEDEMQVQKILEEVYSCNPALFYSDHVDLIEKESLPLLDKDLLNSEESLGL